MGSIFETAALIVHSNGQLKNHTHTHTPDTELLPEKNPNRWSIAYPILVYHVISKWQLYYSAELCVLSILSALTSHSAHGIHYNYSTKTNQMRNFINWYLVSYVSHLFGNSWIHPKEDSYILSMVCFTCIGVSSLVGRSVCSRLESHVHVVGLCGITLSQCTMQKT
jgi:hypothetical protein